MVLDAIGSLLSEYVKGVLVLDCARTVVWCNAISQELTGSPDILGRPFQDLFPVDLDQPDPARRILKNLSGRKYAMRSRPLVLGRDEYVLVTIDEITDFASRDVQLHCLQQVVDTINDGILISDYEGRIVLYNRSQENLEGLAAKDIVGKYLWESYQYKPELSEHRDVYRTCVPITDRYSAHAFKNGIPQYVSYSTFPITKDGETIAVYSISRNENRLQALLHETLELKRRLYGDAQAETRYQNNGTRYHFSDVLGGSREIVGLVKDAETIALVDSPVLITGETGTGKEVFAQSIHNFGRHREEPFVDINCSAIPDNLLESILFGTVKGSYTGAVNQAGLFEQARGGTLFLDEIHSMPVPMQTKLLRVLQEKKVRRVGSLESVQVACRIISAMNEEPEQLIREGKLRQDLYYRLAGVSLNIPPLRERRLDIMPITTFFINRYNAKLNRVVKNVAKDLVDFIFTYRWPGNIRELEHVIENIMIRASGEQEEIGLADIPDSLRHVLLGPSRRDGPAARPAALPSQLRDLERERILASLERNRWNFTQAARDLGIIRQSLDYRMKKLGIGKKTAP